jgi:predicted ATPase
MLFYSALIGQWRYSLNNDNLNAAMRTAERVYSAAEEQNDAALMTDACNALACTTYHLGDIEKAQQYATRGVQLWQSVTVHSTVEEVDSPAVSCLFHKALLEWHLGEIGSCHATMAEAISLARELNDMRALANAVFNSGVLAYFERNASQAERAASDVIELSTRHNFPFWLAIGSILRGWARSVLGNAGEGISWIEQGIADYRMPGQTLGLPCFLGMKAEALYFANRISEAVEAIEEAKAAAQRSGVRLYSAELHRLRGVFLAAICADQKEIEPSFREAIRIAKEQKSISLEKRGEATYAEYRRQKASGSGGRGFRLPL